MELFEIDKKETRKNARQVLGTYRRLQRLTGLSPNPLDLIKSPSYDGMPRSDTNSNGIEHALIGKLNIGIRPKESSELEKIDLAIERLPDISKEILKLTYCERNKYTLNDIAAKVSVYRRNKNGKLEEIFYSTKSIEKLRSEALIEFAEAYEGGRITAFKKI